jgi:CRP-like cAMP-binding protein/Fe-S-cluster-containing hydrogenase component 2
MRACPLPLSSQVNLADLNLATVSDEISPLVTRFTRECVMCGSCVPVCPVNNHRDLLMLSLKQRLGVPWDGVVDMSRVLQFLPPGWTIERLLNHLRAHTFFRDRQQVPDTYLLHFIASAKILTYLPGTVLLHEGAYGREMYFLLEGRCRVTATGPNGAEMEVATLEQGEFVGEHGMLSGQPRVTTVRAQTPVAVLEVPEQTMQRMMELVPGVRHFFEQHNNEHSVAFLLKRLALFQGISEGDFHEIARRVLFKGYERGDLIFSEYAEGQPLLDTVCIILEGFVKVARRTMTGSGQEEERIIAYRQGGDYFAGGLDIQGDGRAVTVTSIHRTRVAEIPQRVMHIIFARYPDIHRRFQQRMQQYQAAASAAQTQMIPVPQLTAASQSLQATSDPEARAGLRALVGGGVVEGTEVLVIDLDKCVQCDKCEDACERRHGHSRMNRKGMVVGNIAIATACRHCQDPVCMLCSRAGIARLPSGEVYITENCIGCGICAERCPYGNISIVSLADEKEEELSTWERFSRFFRKGVGQEWGKKVLPVVNNGAMPASFAPATNALDAMRKKIAIKCDLCAGYSNQACVQACPMGAAFRTNPTTFFGSTEDILHRRVQ